MFISVNILNCIAQVIFFYSSMVKACSNNIAIRLTYTGTHWHLGDSIETVMSQYFLHPNVPFSSKHLPSHFSLTIN